MPRRHEDASQSGRPLSTSSTKSNRSGGRKRRNASRSSAELTVMVQTTCRGWSARAAAAGSARRQAQAAADRGIPPILRFLLPARRRSALRRRRLLPRHLGARLARLGEADRDRLLAALHRLAGAAALQRAVLALVHRAFHLALRFLSITGHEGLLAYCVSDPTSGAASRFAGLEPLRCAAAIGRAANRPHGGTKMSKALCIATAALLVAACAGPRASTGRSALAASSPGYYCDKQRLQPQGDRLECHWQPSADEACKFTESSVLERAAPASEPQSAGRFHTGQWLVRVSPR